MKKSSHFQAVRLCPCHTVYILQRILTLVEHAGLALTLQATCQFYVCMPAEELQQRFWWREAVTGAGLTTATCLRIIFSSELPDILEED